MTFLEQFPPFPVCCLCINLRTGCILTAIYFILESIAQIVGKAYYLSYANPDNDGECLCNLNVKHVRFTTLYYYFDDDTRVHWCNIDEWKKKWVTYGAHWDGDTLSLSNNIYFYLRLIGYVFWTLLGQIAFWHVAQIILAVILLLGSMRVSNF